MLHFVFESRGQKIVRSVITQVGRQLMEVVPAMEIVVVASPTAAVVSNYLIQIVLQVQVVKMNVTHS